MFHSRQVKIQEKLRSEELSDLLVSDPMSIYYYTGYYTQPGERLLLLHFRADNRPILYLNELFPKYKQDNLDLIYYFDGDPIIARIAEELSGTQLGVDKFWPSQFLLELMNFMESTSYQVGSRLVDDMRGIKTDQEIEIMLEASRRNDQAMAYVASILGDNYSEHEIRELLADYYQSTGHQGLSFDPIIAYGPHGSDPHHTTSSAMVKAGDSIVVDIGGIYNHYHSDMTRTFFYQEVSAEQEKVYELVRAANQAAIDAVKPGVSFSEIDQAARSIIEEAGYGQYFNHRTGHFIGLDGHEAGDVGSYNHDLCQPGQIFSIEPGIYLPNKFGVRIEDLVLVTPDGKQVLNQYPKDLTIIS